MLNLERLSDITHELSSNLVRSIVLPRGLWGRLSGHGTRGKPAAEGTPDGYLRAGMVVLCAPGPLPDDAVVATIHRAGTRAFRAVVLAIGADGSGGTDPAAAAAAGTGIASNPLDTGGPAPAEAPPAQAAARALRRYGIPDVRVVTVTGRPDAEREELGEEVRNAEAVVVATADAAGALDVLANTALHRALETVLQLDHTLIAAGEAAFLLGDGMVAAAASGAGTATVPGLSLLPGFVLGIRPVEERGVGALHALGAHLAPQQVGIILDSGAVLAVRGSEARVLGEGTVLVADAREASALCDGTLSSPADSPVRNELPAVCGLRVHILAPGFAFNLLSRRPVALAGDAGPPPAERAAGQF